MKRRRYKKVMDSTVLEMFARGTSMTRIADALNVPVLSIRSVVVSRYPEWDGRKILPVGDIVRRYQDGETVESISKSLDVNHKTIRTRLVDSGVTLRTQSEYQRQHFFNDDFFGVIDSEVKAYWLGFMFADGNVSSRLKDVSISLKGSDREHLEKFAKAVDYVGKGAVVDYEGRISDYHPKPWIFSRMSLRSEKMALDLVDKGCVPNKSLDLSPPSGVPDCLVFHFIRGLSDGDGYVSLGYPALEIVGSYYLLGWVAQHLAAPEPRPHKSIWRIRLNGKAAQCQIERLYKDSTVFLNRKMERAKQHYE